MMLLIAQCPCWDTIEIDRLSEIEGNKHRLARSRLLHWLSSTKYQRSTLANAWLTPILRDLIRQIVAYWPLPSTTNRKTRPKLCSTIEASSSPKTRESHIGSPRSGLIFYAKNVAQERMHEVLCDSFDFSEAFEVVTWCRLWIGSPEWRAWFNWASSESDGEWSSMVFCRLRLNPIYIERTKK